MKIPTFADDLKQAKVWRATNTPESLEMARVALEAAMIRYDDALPLGDELVLVLKGQTKLDEAIDLLRELERRFKEIGEETLCRWGAVYKLRANRSLKSGGMGEALADFESSEKYYARAYEEHHTFYPRINELTVRFVRAGLARQAGRESEAEILRRDVESNADAMLNDPTVWAQRRTDDAIWAPATRGEACFLLRRWAEAEAAYRDAIRAADGKKFYLDCMRDQLCYVLLPAIARLSLKIEGPLADPGTFFS